MYEKEAKQQEEKIEKMKAEDSDNYAIKKQVNFMSTSINFYVSKFPWKRVTFSLICLQLRMYILTLDINIIANTDGHRMYHCK